LLVVLLILGPAWAVLAQSEPVSGRVLIQFKSQAGPKTPNERAEMVRHAGGTVHASFDLVPAVAAELPPEAMKKLRGRPEIESIEEDVVLYAIGQTKPWGVDRIDADLAWPTGNTGKGIKVAILDTGIDYDHPDLKLAGGVNYAGTSRDGYTSPSYWNDNYGHGTHVAGIVAARNNTIGVIGVAPDVSLWAVKVLGDNGSGYTSDIIQGLDWCVAHGIQIASMSFGGGGTSTLKYACDRAYSRGVLLVAAAGNSGGAVGYPAAYSSVMAVSATDSRNAVPAWSSYGPQIDLAAPAVSILSTYKNGTYAMMSGTSMACPHVTGAAALAWASGLTSNWAVRSRLLSTAEDLGTKGFDYKYGYGLVDAQRAAAVRIATTAAAEDVAPAEATTASVRSIMYRTEAGSSGKLDLLIVARVEDEQGKPVASASVEVSVSRSGHQRWALSGTTDADGAATLKIEKATPGFYETTVTELTAEGMTWDGTTPPNGFSR